MESHLARLVPAALFRRFLCGQRQEAQNTFINVHIYTCSDFKVWKGTLQLTLCTALSRQPAALEVIIAPSSPLASPFVFPSLLSPSPASAVQKYAFRASFLFPALRRGLDAVTGASARCYASGQFPVLWQVRGLTRRLWHGWPSAQESRRVLRQSVRLASFCHRAI